MWDEELFSHSQSLQNIKPPDLLNHNMHSHTELINISSRLVLDKIHEVRLSSAQNSFFFCVFFLSFLCPGDENLTLLLAAQRKFPTPHSGLLSRQGSCFGPFLNIIAAAAAKSLQSCPTLCDPRRQPTSLPRPWDSPGKNTGVGCHFLLQCMEVKSESEVAQ